MSAATVNGLSHQRCDLTQSVAAISSARHFLSLSVLRKVVDGMSAAKLNKLHWHLADDQAFPLVLPKLPNLSRLGAFSPAERYSPWEVAAFIEYAASRGVDVIPEVVRAPLFPDPSRRG